MIEEDEAGWLPVLRTIVVSIASGALLIEASHRRLNARSALMPASTFSIAVACLTDPFQVMALSSRASGLFYLKQAVLSF